MSSTSDLITRHWALANTRDWPAFAATLHPGIEYRVPQTRELIRGIDAFVAFYATYPGDWTVTIIRLIADGDSAVTSTAFHVEQHTLTGIAFFTLKDGLIWRIDDWWPEDYSPPPRLVAVERY